MDAIAVRRVYMTAAAERSAAERAARLATLRANRREIVRASEILNRIGARAALSSVLFRAGMVWRDAEDLETKPPLARLVSHNQEALRLELSAIFLAQAMSPPGSIPLGFDKLLNQGETSALTWPRLLGLAGTYRNTWLRVHRAMRSLESNHLAMVPRTRTRPRYVDFALLMEDGSGEAYSCPGGTYSNPANRRVAANMFSVPSEFFTRGWSLVLNAPEIAMFLLISLMSERYPSGLRRPIYINRGTRLRATSLSDEVYVGHRGLAEFGLIELADPIDNRRRGRVSPELSGYIPSYRFRLKPSGLQRAALPTVVRRLGSPVAPHLRHREQGRGITFNRKGLEEEYVDWTGQWPRDPEDARVVPAAGGFGDMPSDRYLTESDFDLEDLPE